MCKHEHINKDPILKEFMAMFQLQIKLFMIKCDNTLGIGTK